MKILHINSYFSTSGLFKQLYDRQLQEGCDIDVYVPISYQYPNEQIAASGEYTIISRNHNQFDRYIFHLKHRKILKDMLTRYNLEQYELIHAHSLFSNGWLAYQAWKKYRIPYIVAVRSTDIRTFFDKMPWLKKLGVTILEHAEKIIFISQNNYNELYSKHLPNNSNLKNKSLIIGNGIDSFWIEHALDYQKKGIHKPLKIVSVGKLIPQKRFIQLAEFAKTYHNNIMPVELHIVGPAWSPKILSQLKQNPVVHYHGPKSKESLRDFFRKMDLFALISSPETFGLVYPEAMSQGLPVIYTKNEGFDSFFNNYEVGVSVSKNDELEFIKAIDYILQHYTQLSQRAVTYSKQFDWDVIHRHYIELYQTIINAHKGGSLNEKS